MRLYKTQSDLRFRVFFLLFIVLFGLFVNKSPECKESDLPNIMNNFYFERDTFPDYNLLDYLIGIPLDSLGFSPDSSHMICDSLFIHSIYGTIPPINTPWIIDNNLGKQDCSSMDTPFKTLCKLLDAYQSGNVDTVISLYLPQNRDSIYSILADSNILQSYTNFITTVSSFNVYIGYEAGNGFLTLLKLNYVTREQDLVPYFLKQNESKWYLAMYSDSTAMAQNLLGYFNRPDVEISSLPVSDDIDNDSHENFSDNCPCIANPDQTDTDNDDVGNVCDNCPNNSNTEQKDVDQDGIGDACDNCRLSVNPDQSDTDNDNIGDACDNCPNESNTSQSDTDNDEKGDACDNCPVEYNTDQSDTDNDQIGDVCDNCPAIPNNNQSDIDNDGMGDACDNDLDGDGVPNIYDIDMDNDTVNNPDDNCMYTPNPDQADTDNDGVGDTCDNCIGITNSDQSDKDFDGIGNACDEDEDGDGIPNATDNCPHNFNPQQEDTDCDGIGDTCDQH